MKIKNNVWHTLIIKLIIVYTLFTSLEIQTLFDTVYIRCMQRVMWLPVSITSLEFAHWPIQGWVSKPMTDTGSHVTLRIHLRYSMPTFNTLFSIILLVIHSIILLIVNRVGVRSRSKLMIKGITLEYNYRACIFIRVRHAVSIIILHITVVAKNYTNKKHALKKMRTECACVCSCHYRWINQFTHSGNTIIMPYFFPKRKCHAYFL